MLNEIIRTNQTAFNQIANGTHATETYNDNNMYCVELDTPIEVGASGSGLIVSNNQLLCVLPICPAATDGTFTLTATVASGVVTYSWVANT